MSDIKQLAYEEQRTRIEQQAAALKAKQEVIDRQGHAIARLESELARFKDERSYIVGFNDGWDECAYQHKHGKPSE